MFSCKLGKGRFLHSNLIFSCDAGAISHSIESLELALESPKRRHEGFSPTELAEGLSRMAVNDSNKMKVSDEKYFSYRWFCAGLQ